MRNCESKPLAIGSIHSSLFSILSITFSNSLKRLGGEFGVRCQVPTRNAELRGLLISTKALEVIIVQIITYSIVQICAQIDASTASFPFLPLTLRSFLTISKPDM